MSQYSQTEVDILIREYPSGGVKGVQKYLSRSGDSIRHKAVALKINVIDGFLNSLINLDELINITTPEVSYMLGIIWGDGFLNERKKAFHISLTLKESDFKDVEHLFYKFHKYKVKKMKESWQQCYCAFIGHKLLGTFLKENDYKVKSFVSPNKILSKIPEHLHHYFFRGWFDADGYNNGLPNGKMSIVMAGSYVQDWKALESLYKKLKIEYKIDRVVRKSKNGKINKYSILAFATYNKAIAFRDYLCQGVQIGLKRKRDNFFNIRPPKRPKALHPLSI